MTNTDPNIARPLPPIPYSPPSDPLPLASRFVEGVAQVGKDAAPRRVSQRCRLNCTHVVMDRLYGPYFCDLCQHPSPLGWLYKCSQDEFAADKTLPITTEAVSDMPSAGQLRAFGFSESIISQADVGVFDPAQMQFLLDQRKHLCKVLAAAEPATLPGSDEASRVHSSSQRGIKLSQPAPVEVPEPTADIVRKEKQRPCYFKCCHRCRPYMIDRGWTSFGAVFADEVRPLSLDDIKILPIRSPWIARTLGQSPNETIFEPDTPASSKAGHFYDSSPNTSFHKTETTSDFYDSFPYSEGSSSTHEDDEEQQVEMNALGQALTTMYLGAHEDTSLHQRSARRTAFSTPCPFPKRTIRYVSSSDDRSSPSTSVSRSSSVSLPTPGSSSPLRVMSDSPAAHSYSSRIGTLRVHEAVLYQNPTASCPTISVLGSIPRSMSSRNPSTCSVTGSSQNGDEAELEGRVALTEEALRTHTPDLVIE